MREERGQLLGDQVVYEAFTLWGSVAGNVTVVRGGKFYARGTIFGDLRVEAGGRVHIFGHVTGNVSIADDTKLIHSGTIGGDAINEGGRLFIEPMGKVNGKVRTVAGETKDDSKPAG